MRHWISGQYKWCALPVFTLALVLSYVLFAAQGQLLPSGGLLSTFIILKSLPAFKLIEAVSYPLSVPIKELQVGGGLLVPSLAVRRQWLLAGRAWFFERWFWVSMARMKVFGQVCCFTEYIQTLSRGLFKRLDSFLR